MVGGQQLVIFSTQSPDLSRIQHAFHLPTIPANTNTSRNNKWGQSQETADLAEPHKPCKLCYFHILNAIISNIKHIAAKVINILILISHSFVTI